MRYSVNEIMRKIAATVNQEASAPTARGAEYNLWLEYINRGLHEWSEAHDWEPLRKTFFPSITGQSQVTIALPLDYKKLAAAPRLQTTGGVEGGTEYGDIPPEQRGEYNQEDKYVIEGGNPSGGYFLQFHPGTLSSGASIEIQYFSMPTSLASPADIPVIPDTQFLIDRTVAYIFEARSDPRFQQEETKARDRLLGMVENAGLSKFSSYGTPNPVQNTLRRAGFRLGRDG